MVKFLVEKGAKIDAADKDGRTPLYNAAYKGHMEMVKFLLEKGAKIDAADKGGETPLYSAAFWRHMEVVKFLVEKGAKIDAENQYGRTPLQMAASNDHIEVVKFLVEKGAKIDAADKGGWTPLSWAALMGHIEVVKFLLKNGANVSGVEVKEKILKKLDFSFIPLFFVGREYESALKIVDKLLQDSKEIIPLHLARAKILALQEPEKNSKQVIEIYKAAHKLEPNNYEVLRLLVIYQCRTQEEGTKFIQGIKDHLSANPGDVDLLHQQAMFHLLEEDERSLKKALSICEILPISRVVQTIQAFALLGLGHYADAQAKFSALQAQHSDDKYINFGLAECFRALKQYKEAENFYVKLESIMTSLDDLVASVYMSHAQLKQALGLSKEAEELLKKIDLNCLVSEGTKEEICDQQKVCRQEEEFRSHMVQLGVVSEYKMQEEELRVAIEKIFHTDRMREHFIKIREFHKSTAEKIDAYGGNKIAMREILGYSQNIIDKLRPCTRELLVCEKGRLWGIVDVFRDILQIQGEIEYLVKRVSKSTPDSVAIFAELAARYGEIKSYYDEYINGMRAKYPDQMVLHTDVGAKKAVAAGEEVEVITEHFGRGYLTIGSGQQVSVEGQKSQSEYGKHAVIMQDGVVYKYSPYAPGLEFAVTSLGAILAGRITKETVPHELISLTDVVTSRKALLLASKDMGKFTLDYVLKYHPEQLDKLDMCQYAQIIMLSLLTCPGDGKADNFIAQLVRYDQEERLHIVGIDNDIAFAKGVVRLHKSGQRKVYTKVLNVLYCLKQMDSSVDEGFRRHFLAVDYNPEKIVFDWLFSLAEKNAEYDKLKSAGFTEQDFRELKLPINLIPHTASGVYQKLKAIQHKLRAAPKVTYQELLEELYPDVGRFYRDVREKHGTPEKCNEYLYALRATTREEENKILTASRAIKKQFMRTVSTTSMLSPEKFGAKFVSPIQTEMENFLAHIDYNTLSPEATDAYLRILQEYPHLRVLTLHGYKLETVEGITGLIGKNHQLTTIRLIQCPQFTGSHLIQLFTKKPNLAVEMQEMHRISIPKLGELDSTFPNSQILFLIKAKSYKRQEVKLELLVQENVKDTWLLAHFIQIAPADSIKRLIPEMIKKGNKEAVEIVLKQHKSIRAIPLMDIAVESNQWSIVCKLEELGFKASNAHNIAKYGVFKQKGTLLVVEELQVSRVEEIDWLHVTVDQLVRFFTDRKIEINAKDANGNTLLHQAVIAGNQRQVELLLDIGADEDIANAGGETALSLAKEDVMRSAIHKAMCSHEAAVLRMYVERGHVIEALYIISNMPLKKLRANIDGKDLLSLSISASHFIIAERLAERRVDLNLKYGITQESVLHILIAKGQESALEHDRIVECFVQHGCNADIANSEGLSALKKAVQLKQYRVAAILMNHQGRFRDQEKKHVILDKAAECGFTIKPEDFEQAFDWEQKKDGNNLLELAVHNDDLSFFKTLLPKYEKFLMKDTEIGALLHFIAGEKRLEIFEHAKAVLQARGIMPPPMHLFIQVDLEKKMGAILADIHWEITTQEAFYGIDPNKLNARGNTILYELIKYRHKNGIRTLFEMYQHKIDVNLIGRSDGFTSLHLAVCSNQIAVVERLIEEGASLKRYDKWGHSALDIAISSPVYDDEKVVREQIVTFLIQVLSAPHAGHEYDLFLHESMYRGQKDTVTRLISSFPRQLDWAGDLAELCPVDYAMGTLGPKELVETRRAFARPHSRDATQFDDFEGSKLLNALPEEDYNLESIVTKYSWMMLNEYLIKNPPTQDAIDKALLVAVKEGKFEHMQCLLSRPSVELLHVAAERGHAKILLELIKNAPPSFVIESIDGKTALDLAIKSRSKTCVQYLLHKGARATSVDVDEMTENLCKETAETSEDKSKALACLNAFGDDRDLTKHAHDLRYWYSITDGIRLLIDIRQKLLRYTGAANVGEEAMALRENVDGIFVSDPYYTTNFGGYLRDDVAKITDGWRVMPKLIIIPVLYGVHWRVIAIEIGYEARRTRVLRDDPYGQGKFVALSGEFLEAIRHNIELLMRKQLRDDSFVLDSIEQREKEQDQQGSGENSWDCGPIVFSNIRDYVRTKSVEDVQYTIPPNSQRSPDFMANARVGDAEVCRAISGIEATGSNLQDISDGIQQKRDGKLHDLMEVLEEETLKIAISGLDPRHVSLLFSILETNRYLTGENVGKSYNVEELKAAYQMVTTLSVDSMAGRGTNSHSVDSWWCEYSVEGMRTLLPLRMAGFGVQFVSPVVMLGNLIIFPSFPSDFSTLVVPVLYSGHWMGFILQKDLNSCKVTFIDPENQQMPEGLTGFLTKLHIPSLKFEQKLMQPQSSNNCGPEFIEDVAETVTGARSPEHLVPAAHSELLAKVLWMRENFRLIEPAVATVACCIGVILFQQTKGIVIQAGCAEMFLKALWEEVEKHIAEKHSILEDGQALDVASNVQTETESAVGFYKIMQQFIEDIHSAWSMSSWAPALLKAIENWLSWDRDETDENIARTFQFLEIANSIGEMPLPFGGGHGPPDNDNGGYGGGDGGDKDAGNKDSSGGGFIELAGNTTKVDGEYV